MAVFDGDKLTRTVSWRKFGFPTRENEQSKASWRASSKRPQLKDSSQSRLKSLMKRHSRRSFHEARDRPKSLSSGYGPSEEDLMKPITASKIRSSSAPMLKTNQSSSPARTAVDSNRHISFEPNGEIPKLMPDETISGTTPNDTAPNGDNDVVHQDVSGSEALPTPSESPSRSSTERKQQDDNQSSKARSQSEGSGSVPTQLINLSDGPSEDSGLTLPTTVTEFQQALKDRYGTAYQQSNDIAGLELRDDARGDALSFSLGEFFAQLQSMSGKDATKTRRSLRESISSCLDPPSSYSESILDAASRVIERNWIARSYVSAWIFMTLAMSRVDGLRMTYAIYLMFWIQRIDQRSLYLSELATKAQDCWFLDNSNLPFEETDPRTQITHSRVRTGCLTGANSTNSSKVPAVISGSDQGEQSATSPAGKAVLVDFAAEVSATTPNQGPANDESESSTPHEVQPAMAQTEQHSEMLRDESSTASDRSLPHVQEEGATQMNTESELLERTTESVLEQDWNNVSANARQVGQHTSIVVLHQKLSRQGPLRSADGQLECTICKKKFLKRGELENHVEVRHQEYDDMNHGSPPPPYQVGSGNLYSMEHPIQAEEVEKPKVDNSLSRELAKQPQLLLSRDFHSRSTREASRFFVVGRVLEMLWHESASPWSSIEMGSTRSQSPNLTTSSYGESVSSHIRRFLVVKAQKGYCLALPINTYGGRGLSKKNVSEDERRRHAIIYDRKKTPQKTPEEPSFTKEAIPVELAFGQTLSVSSRVHFGKPQSIEWSAKVKHVGMVKGDRDLRNLKMYFQTELARGEDEESIIEDEEGETNAILAR